MERWRNNFDAQTPRKCRNCPSFSSTLLDAIYRSIDEADTDIRGPTKKENFSSSRNFAENRRIVPPATNPRRAAAEPPSRLAPIRTTPPPRSDRIKPNQFIDEKRSRKDHRQGSIKSYLRDPKSPGARLTNFVASIFAAKSKVSAESPCARSCLSKTPSAGKRTVRFCPASEGCEKRGVEKKKIGEEEVEEEDLFELKNLGFIGRGRFRDELPVFETAILGKCNGVSRGLIL